MNPSGSAPTEVLALRVLRVVARVGLAAIVTFLIGLVLGAVSTRAQEAVLAMLGWGDHEIARDGRLVLFALAVLMLAGLLSWLGRRLAWRALAVGYAAVAPVLIYLAVDDAVLRRPQTLEEFSPSFPGAEASYSVLMRYGNQRPAGRDFRNSKLLRWVGYDPKKPELWIKFVTEHRAEIEAEWKGLVPARAWWAELNAFERIGDRMPPRQDAEQIAFRPVRELSQRACAIATLRALDGRGDEAIEIVLPLLEVARKLQPFARSLVHAMIAIVIERMAMETAGFALDRATVSPEVRARLAAALAAPGGGEAGARRLVAIEYVLAVNTYTNRPLGDCVDSVAKLPAFRQALNAVSPFVYNPRATLNLYADLTTDEEEIVSRRQLEKLEPRQKKFYEQDAAPRFKNFMGALFVHQLIPATSKVIVAYWKVQDARAALLARVAPP